MSENNCMQSMLFIETEHLLDKIHGRQLNWRPRDHYKQAPHELAPTLRNTLRRQRHCRLLMRVNAGVTSIDASSWGPMHVRQCYWRLLLLVWGCVNSSGASSTKLGYFGFFFKNWLFSKKKNKKFGYFEKKIFY